MGAGSEIAITSGLECSKTMDVTQERKGKEENKGFWNVLVTGKFLSFIAARRLCLGPLEAWWRNHAPRFLRSGPAHLLGSEMGESSEQ